jgi:MFS family permease
MARSTSWRHVFILFLAGVAVALQIGKVPGAIPLLKDEFALTLVAAGWVVSIFSLIAALSGALFGVFGARVGPARLAIYGMALAAVASAAGAFASTPALLLATRVVEGLGFIATVVSIPLLLTAVTARRDRDVAMGLWGAFMPLGTGGMLLLSAPLLDLIGWRGLWLFTAAVIAVVAVFVHAAAKRASVRMGEAERPHIREILQVATRPRPLLLAIVFGLYAGQYLVMLGFLPLILVEQHGLSGPAAAAWVAAIVLSNALGNVASGIALRHGVPARTSMVLACLVMGLTACVVYLDVATVYSLAAAFAFSAFGGLIPGSLFALAPAQITRVEHLPSVSGLMVQGSSIGQFLMPPAIAALVAYLGNWAVAGPAGLVAMSIAAFLAVRLTRRRDRASDQTGPETAPAPGSAHRNGRSARRG